MTTIEVGPRPKTLEDFTLLEQLNGKAPLVAPGVDKLTALTSPNSPYGAQPENSLASGTPVFDALASSYPQLPAEFDEPTPNAHDVEWRGRIPTGTRSKATDTAEIVIETVPDERPASQEVEAEPASEYRSPKWNSLHDLTSYAMSRLAHPELWSGRTRTALGLGGLTLSIAGLATAAYGMRKGIHSGEIPHMHMFGGHHTLDTSDHNPAATPDVPSTTHPSSEPTTPPEAPAATPETSMPATATPEPEHFRLAISYDHSTGRPSTVYDWSVEALKHAGKDAELPDDQIRALTHDHTAVNHVNSGFFDENHAVKVHRHHYLDAGTKYHVDNQGSAATNEVIDWKAAHMPHTDTGSDPSGINLNSSPEPSTTMPPDKELADLLRQLNSPEASAAVHTTPDAHHNFIGWFTEKPAERISLAAGVGTLAAAAVIVVAGRHRRDQARYNERHHDDWGINHERERIANRRAFPEMGRPATVPSNMNPYRYWELTPAERAALKDENKDTDEADTTKKPELARA